MHPNGHELLLQLLFGTQAYTGDTHLTSFTRLLLEHHLEQTGFTTVTWSLRDEWLFEIVARKVTDAPADPVGDRHARLLANRDVETFVAEAYEEILGREPDPEGKHYWSGALRTGTVTYREMLEALENAAPQAPA